MISFIGKGKPSSERQSLMDITQDYSVIMNERSKRHSWQGLGPLSLKVALRGEADYFVGQKKLRIDKSRFMMLNDAQKYRIQVDCPYETETFIVFFNRRICQSVANSFQRNHSQLLDSAHEDISSSVHFRLQTMPMTSDLLDEVNNLQQMMIHHHDQQLVQEKLYEIFQNILTKELSKESIASDLSKAKSSTREEIQKRISIAIDYLHALYHQSITLDELSKESCLSKNHFLRTFRQVHGMTPFQYLFALRVEKAKDLLRHSDLPVAHVCNLTGFESLGYFSWMFKKQTGFSPSAFREIM